jgi:hypothetical protein
MTSIYRNIVDKIGNLAKRHGSRLSVAIVAIGDKQNFPLLDMMVNEAKEYRSSASLMLPSMSLSDFGTAVSFVSSTVTQSQHAMTDVYTFKQRKDRKVIRESRSHAARKINYVDDEEFSIFPIEHVERTEYNEWFVDRKRHSAFAVMTPQHLDAAFVAVCKKSFGEGCERFAFRFYEVASDRRTIVGKPMVAKESRHVLDIEEGNDESDARTRFVKKFCTSQQLARRLAEEFNEKLNSIHRVSATTPHVTFLDCSVYKIEDIHGKKSSLVEERLDESKWQKWNANNGYVVGMHKVPELSAEVLRNAMTEQTYLDKITEGQEEEEVESDEDELKTSATTENNGTNLFHSSIPIVLTPSEVAQAFSHFTYYASGRKRLVCDLQGVYDTDKNELRLSDPVIHYYNDIKREQQSRRYGNTDHGQKGMA